MLTTYQKRVVHNCFIKNSVFKPLFRGMMLEFLGCFFQRSISGFCPTQKVFWKIFLGYEIKISTNSQRGIFSTLPRWSGPDRLGHGLLENLSKGFLKNWSWGPRWWSEIWSLDLFSRRPPVFGNFFQGLPINRVPSSKS